MITNFFRFILLVSILASSFFLFNSAAYVTNIPQELESMIQSQHPLPRYEEEGYRPLGRSPVVDALLGDPFYLPAYATIVAEKLKESTLDNSLYELSSAVFIAGGIPLSAESRDIPNVWKEFIQIYQGVEAVLSTLTKNEKQWLRDNYEAFFFGEQAEQDYDFFTTDSPVPVKFFSLAARVDLAQLAECARKLCRLVDIVYAQRSEFENLKDAMWIEDGVKFIISRQSYSTLNESADFYINLGSHNTFYNNAGGTEGVRPAALFIDFSGNNHFIGDRFVQGCGFLGVGVLASFSGNNTYQANTYSQGAGFFGSGILMNLGSHNHYELKFFGQSCAAFGSSLLWNKGGHSLYLAHEGMAQAASSTLGVAFLVDNSGNNTFIAGIEGKDNSRAGGIAQAASIGVRNYPWKGNLSLYGGLSFLFNGGGNNTFKTVWYGQGSAYFLGAGILVQEGGNNDFFAEVNSQGQGLHLAAGLLLTKGENNRFDGGWGSLGVAGDRSIGMFMNSGGHNTYKGSIGSIGTARKPKALGVFIDLDGNNSYEFKATSNTNIQKPRAPSEWPTALFLELGPNNSYPQNIDEMERRDELRWGVENHSFGISEAYETSDFMSIFPQQPRVQFPFDPLNGWSENTAFKPLPVITSSKKSSYNQRRQMYESSDLANRPLDIKFFPADMPEDLIIYAASRSLLSPEEAVQLLEEGNISAYARKISIKLVTNPVLLGHLVLTDPSEENQATAAYYLARYATKEHVSSLQTALRHTLETIRYAAAKGLQDSQLPIAVELVFPLFNDESFYVRRAAAMTAISLGEKEGIPVLLETLKFNTLDTSENYGDNLYNILATYVGVNFGVNREAWIQWWSEVHDTFEFPQAVCH